MSARIEFRIDEPSVSRFEAAMDLLSDGEPIVYRGIELRLSGDKGLEVSVEWTPRLGELTTLRAKEAIEAAIREIDQLAQVSSAFAALIKGRTPRYSIFIWDGMTDTEIYSEDVPI